MVRGGEGKLWLLPTSGVLCIERQKDSSFSTATPRVRACPAVDLSTDALLHQLKT